MLDNWAAGGLEDESGIDYWEYCRGWGGRRHSGRIGEGGRVAFWAVERVRPGRAQFVARGGRREDGRPLYIENTVSGLYPGRRAVKQCSTAASTRNGERGFPYYCYYGDC